MNQHVGDLTGEDIRRGGRKMSDFIRTIWVDQETDAHFTTKGVVDWYCIGVILFPIGEIPQRRQKPRLGEKQ